MFSAESIQLLRRARDTAFLAFFNAESLMFVMREKHGAESEEYKRASRICADAENAFQCAEGVLDQIKRTKAC